MLPVSKKAELTWSPVDPPGEGDPVFRYRPSTKTQREQWRARVLSKAGGNPSDDDIRRIVLAGIDELWSETADREALAALWDEGQAAQVRSRDIIIRVNEAKKADPDVDLAPLQAEFEEGAMPPERVEQLERLDDTLRMHYSPYARALEKRSLWAQMAPRVAVEMFCTGWSDVKDAGGNEILFRRSGGEIDADALARLDDDHLTLLGYRIIDAMFPGAIAAKKPASPSGSADAAKSSSDQTETSSSAPTAKAGS
jgi:hypothetical protein